MKTITKERILKALERVSEYQGKRWGRHHELMRLFAHAGLKQACGVAPTDRDHNRLSLEMTYLSQPQNTPALLEMRDEWEYGINRCWYFRDKIFSLQQRYQVSGIETETCEFRGSEITYPWASWDLRWIPQDLDSVEQHKERVTAWFLEQAFKHDLPIWRRRTDEEADSTRDDWDKVEPQELSLLVALPSTDWAHVFGHGDDELNIDIGHGLDPEARGISLWFCVSERKPAL